MEKKYLEDFSIGEKFESGGRTLTEADVVLFAGITGQAGPLFLDEEYAKTTMYGTRIVPGMLALSMAMGLVRFQGMGLLGLDQVKWIKPTRPGDTIHTVTEVVSTRETTTPGRGILTLKHTVYNQKSELVIEFERTYMMQTKARGKGSSKAS